MSGKTQEQIDKEFELAQPYCHLCDDFKVFCACSDYADGNALPTIFAKDDGVMEEFGPGYPDNNPKTAFGLAKIPLHLVPPSSLHALANAFADGAEKYGPFNWREKAISSTVYYAAVMRHLTAWFDGEEVAQDSGKPHLDHALACIAMLIDGKSVGKLNDNRPPKGAAAQMQADYIKLYTDSGVGGVG